MVSWRCPHCGAPQREAAQCWVCGRSTTSCSTCRHFRRSVAFQLGFCALDRHRTPLIGDEERACWERSGREAETELDRGAPFRVRSGADGRRDERERAANSTSVPADAGRDIPRTTSSDDEGSWLWVLAAGPGSLPIDADEDDLWSMPAFELPVEPEPPRLTSDDRTVRSAGLWPEFASFGATDSPALSPVSTALETLRKPHGGSIRSRPWGKVPGRDDPALRGLRMPDRIRRPGI